MAESNHFDVIVIGSGSGGEGAAMGLTKRDSMSPSLRKKLAWVADVLIGVQSPQNRFAMPSAVSSNLITILFFAITTPVSILPFLIS